MSAQSNAIELQKDGVVFTVNLTLWNWVLAENGKHYGFSELESIVMAIRAASDATFHRVELYGVPESRRVYAKMFGSGKAWEEKWLLEFGDKGKRLSRIQA